MRKIDPLRLLGKAVFWQVNFAIRLTQTQSHHIQTFRSSDTLMVLFEDNEGTLEQFAADDDRGWNRNAYLEVRLIKGKQYVLRVRLYYTTSSGNAAVMMR